MQSSSTAWTWRGRRRCDHSQCRQVFTQRHRHDQQVSNFQEHRYENLKSRHLRVAGRLDGAVKGVTHNKAYTVCQLSLSPFTSKCRCFQRIANNAINWTRGVRFPARSSRISSSVVTAQPATPWGTPFPGNSLAETCSWPTAHSRISTAVFTLLKSLRSVTLIHLGNFAIR